MDSKLMKFPLCKEDFGEDFIFGGASSAYQTEGAASEDGKGPSNWDHFTTKYPDRVIDKSNGSIAIDNYHLWKEDVRTMKKLGLHAFRFSISWPRVLPGGRISKGVNREGVNFYNSLINELLANGITPFVTLFHWDVPQALDDEYQGFLSTKIVGDFAEFAQVCFWEFGDRVKHWITLNEPWSFAWGGYVAGSFAPGRGATSHEHVKEHVKHSHPSHRAHHSTHAHAHVNDEGNPGTEPYIVAHNLILAHAEAVKAYREFFQPAQKGKIGITLVSKWWEPLYDTPEDHGAALRAVDFMLGWFIEPLTSGKYPQSMVERVKNRLPKFSAEDAGNVKGSYDFIGLNYYTTVYATDASNLKINTSGKSYETDQQVKTQSVGPDGKTLIGPQAGSNWLFIYPIGIYKLLRHIQKNYNDPEIYITENGVNEVNNPALPVVEALKDTTRIKYHQDHLAYIKKAMDVDGVKVKGYIIWAVFDNFEWAEGYTVRFGMVYVDYKNNFTRFPKQSALWLMKFLTGGSSVTEPAPMEEERVKAVVDNKNSKRKFSSVA